MKNLILLIPFCLWMSACKERSFDPILYTTTVKVVDLDGVPLQGRSVNVFSYPNESVSTITDKNGQAVLKYHGYVSGSHLGDSDITVSDESFFKGVNHFKHQAGEIISQPVVLRMDSLIPFKVRIKTNRDDVASVNIQLTNEPIFPYTTSLGRDIIKREFMKNSIQTSTSKLDTLISVMVLSKNDAYMRIDMKFLKDTTITKVTRIYPFSYKDTVFLQEF